jgi:cholesterol oxidase
VDHDVIIIGSGFGGSVSAMRLVDKGYNVCVIEAGKRWRTNDFPKTNWNLRKSLWFPRLGMRGIQRISLLSDIMALSGVGVGGGSLVYANTHYVAPRAFYNDPQWHDITDWEAELAPHYEVAQRMLGVVENPADTPADTVMRKVADRMGVPDTFHPTPVAVYFGEPGVETDDPYFDGEGPRRSGCTSCGNCMVGCRFGAKNTLDKNYLYFAEKRGATVYPNEKVTDLEKVDRGWRVTTQRPGAWFRKRSKTRTASEIIFSAGGLGTTRLLLELQERGRLPHISPRVGHLVRTNSEALLGVVSSNRETDFTRGVAITSSIHPTEDTHIEPVRYGKGSNALALLGTLLTDGGPGRSRQMRFLSNVLHHPIAFLRTLSVRRWSERGIILLVMQTKDNSLRLFRRKGWFGTRLTSQQGHGEPNPTYIPEANDAARHAADIMGGSAMSSVNEVLFDTPTTAHLIGGATIGRDRDTGVVDAYHRVWRYPSLHVIDGAAIGANLGVNPSLTITAMAERAVEAWPQKGEPDPRPKQGKPYRQVGTGAS